MSTDSASPRAADAGPIPQRERHELIDVVRGFSLYGVLLGNLILTTQYLTLTATQRATMPSAGLDRVAGAVVTGLIDYKFYTLFSILFGLGFAVQMERGHDRPGHLRTYARRLAILAVLGLLHAWLLWFGDVLHVYALLGFVLLAFRSASNRVVLATATICWTIRLLLSIFDALLPGLRPEPSGEGAIRFETLAQGGYGDIVATNLARFTEDYSSFASISGYQTWYLDILARFLFGLYVGRRLWLQRPEDHAALFRNLVTWGLPIGLLGNAILVVGDSLYDVWLPSAGWPWVLTVVPIETGMISLSLGYLGAISLLYLRPRGRRTLSWLAPMGRMALTNYLMQSVVMVLLFYGIGGGWLGKVGTAGCVVVGSTTYVTQLLLSHWWLQRYRFGPAEWLWRSLTYGSRQPFLLICGDGRSA